MVTTCYGDLAAADPAVGTGQGLPDQWDKKIGAAESHARWSGSGTCAGAGAWCMNAAAPAVWNARMEAGGHAVIEGR